MELMKESKITQQQKQYKILLLGDNCTDVYQYGTVDTLSPEAPVPIFKFKYQESRPGMAGNVYSNLKSLGCEVEYLHRETSIKTRLIDIKSRQHIVRIDHDIISKPIDIHSFTPSLYNVIVVSDYNKGTISYQLVEDLISTGIPVFVDTKKTDLQRFDGAWVKINELEYNKVQTKCSKLIVTKGERGVMYNQLQVPSFKVEVVDVTGAGDTFLAALCYKFLESNNIESAIKFANKASSITVQHFGCYAPSLDEINFTQKN